MALQTSLFNFPYSTRNPPAPEPGLTEEGLEEAFKASEVEAESAYYAATTAGKLLVQSLKILWIWSMELN